MKLKIGIYNLHMQTKGGGEKRTLVLADHLSRSHDVTLFVAQQLDLLVLENYFGVDLSRVDVVHLDDNHIQARPQRLTTSPRWEVLSRTFGHFRRIKSFKIDLFINNSYCSNLPCPAPLGIYMCMFPHVHPRANITLLRWIYRAFMDRFEDLILGCRVSDFIDSYSTVTANSRFTAEWIERLWRRRPEIVYSVCDTMGPSSEKQRIILNVGRFVADDAGKLYKRQDVLLHAFSQLTGLHEAGWQLHFAGSVETDAQSEALVDRLENSARGFPAVFHFDADLSVLRDLYRSASLYWHATGYGFPASQYPHFQEHFGMTTIEAMSAGAVPVVINSGGQNEIVTNAVDGFLWDELSTLSDHTVRLIQDSDVLRRFSQQAIRSTARFNRAAFTGRIDGIIEGLTSVKVTPAVDAATTEATG